MNASSVYLWPFLFTSLGLHGLLGFILLSKSFFSDSDLYSKTLMVQIIEERKAEEPREAPTPPFRKKIEKPQVGIREEKRISPPLEPLQEKDLVASAPHIEPAEQKVSQVFEISKEKTGVEEKPKEKGMEKAELGRWGIPDGPQDAEPVRPGKEEPPMNLTADSGSAQKGIPGGLAAQNPWGRGAGGEAGYPGGAEGGKGTVPAQGEKTGSVYFQGEGKGRGDLGSYLGNARMRIEKAKRYPPEARRKGWEGKVVLSFEINRKGEVGQIRLIQSSGYPDLDEEGIATLRRASPFPSPLLIEKEKVVLEVPLIFRLEEPK